MNIEDCYLVQDLDLDTDTDRGEPMAWQIEQISQIWSMDPENIDGIAAAINKVIDHLRRAEREGQEPSILTGYVWHGPVSRGERPDPCEASFRLQINDATDLMMIEALDPQAHYWLQARL